ncbi:SDR family NAD(P)-dependent oxidoreductase [Sphingobium sp. TCM1]|uniref:SDR family NAD(P)-dependent oxidoreductase n=1 Tax=Sphingobium sp. TCM1 TaxID=453246 RepID=UPI0007F4049D|nr:SDR family oxidoreductase [Sphingobium sp. TCM1]OAN56235.1 short-chain dehydrogenase [Sphingobium sp. TCM1]
MSRLDGKVAIITGGGSGIGAATAKLMAERGAKVAVTGRTEANLADVVDAIGAAGGDALAVAADMQDESSIAAMAEKVAGHFGRIDILASNAAMTDPAAMMADGPVIEMDSALWDRTMAVNLRGAMLACKYTIPHMLKTGGGAIVFSGSGKGLQGDLDQIAYGTSKAGLIGLMKYVATQYGKQGIRANLALIGLVMTEALDRTFPDAAKALFMEHHLTPYLGKPEHVAEVIAFLASDAAAFVTSAVVPVDGGFTAHSPVFADVSRMKAQMAGRQ